MRNVNGRVSRIESTERAHFARHIPDDLGRVPFRIVGYGVHDFRTVVGTLRRGYAIKNDRLEVAPRRAAEALHRHTEFMPVTLLFQKNPGTDQADEQGEDWKPRQVKIWFDGQKHRLRLSRR